MAQGRAELVDAVGTLKRKAEVGARLHDATERAGAIKTRAGELPGRAAEGMARLGESVPDLLRSTPPARRGFLARHRIPVVGVVVVVVVGVALRIRTRRNGDTSHETYEAAPRPMASERSSTHQSA